MKIKEERDQLENILNTSSNNLNGNVPEKNPIEGVDTEPLIDIDISELSDKCEKEARVMILNAIKFVIPPDIIEDSEYLQNKLEVDVMSLSGMIYQLRLNQEVQRTLTKQISSGLNHARYFEVFATMSKTIGDLNKQLIQTVEAIKETYKTFKEDVKEKRTEAMGPTQGTSGMITTGDGGVVTRGTKELINKVKEIKKINVFIDPSSNFIDEAGLIPNIINDTPDITTKTIEL